MAEDVFGYLQSKNVAIRRAPGDNIHTHCFYCDEEPSGRGRLYINVDPDAEIPGLFFCHLCGKKGALGSIRKHFGDPPIPQDKPDYTPRYNALQAAAKYYHGNLEEHPEVVQWLTETRGLTPETIRKHKLGYAAGDLTMHLLTLKIPLDEIKATGLVVERDGELKDFLKDEVTIPYHSGGSVVQIRGKEIGGKYRTTPGTKSSLFNVDSLVGAKDVVVTEGEFDALIAEQLGYNAIGLPGANGWQEKWNSKLAQAKRVYGVFDNDKAGREGLEKIAHNLGSRFRSVTVPAVMGPEDKNDISAWVVEQGATRDDFDELLRSTSGGLLITVREAFDALEEVNNAVGLQFGMTLLDELLQPGLLPAQVCVVLAKTGTGKTIFLINEFELMMKVHPEIRILFISLEQTRNEWAERATRINGFYNPSMAINAVDGPSKKQFVANLREDTIKRWEDHMMIVDKNRLTEDELFGCINDYKESEGRKPDLIAVDYLGYWAATFPGKDKYQKVTDAVMSLKAVAKEESVPILVPHQVSRMAEFGKEPDIDAARDSGAVEETADFIFSLWNPDNEKGKEAADRKGDINLRIGKSRHGGAGTKEVLKFAPLSLALLPTGPAGLGSTDPDSQALVQYANEELELLKLMQSRGAKNYSIDWVAAQQKHAEAEFRRTGVF